MKLTYKTLFMSAVAGLALASCSNVDEETQILPQQQLSFNLKKAPEMKCSSNDIELGAKAGWWYYKEQHEIEGMFPHFAENMPEAITEDEQAFVLQYLAEHPNEGSTEFNHYNYFIQYLGGSNQVYDTTTPDWNGVDYKVTGSKQMDYIRLVDQNNDVKHVNDYNVNGGPVALILNLKITEAIYHDSWGDKNQEHNNYLFYTIEYNGKKNMYLCFDYTMEKNDQSSVAPDGVYNDYVIKITPACGEVETPNVDPDDPTPGVDPEDPAVVVKEGEVEVNLAVQDHKDENSSKLSVHVRDTVNFKVFIPVSDQYYCNEDDMYIVEKHYENMTYNVNNATVEREIAGQKVVLNITYAAEGIYIESEGINAKVLEYCREVYGDGITFEVWNYYNSAISRDELITLLNQATIEFTDNEPQNYICAKPLDENGDYKNRDEEGRLLDCTVEKK